MKRRGIEIDVSLARYNRDLKVVEYQTAFGTLRFCTHEWLSGRTKTEDAVLDLLDGEAEGGPYGVCAQKAGLRGGSDKG
jgi:hypothetical protein